MATAFRQAPDAEFNAYASLDGFNEGGTPRSFSFIGRNPEARWVKNNLLPGMLAETVPLGERITVETTALGRVVGSSWRSALPRCRKLRRSGKLSPSSHGARIKAAEVAGSAWRCSEHE